MQRPRRSSITSPVSPLASSSNGGGSLARRPPSPSSFSSSNLRRTPSSHLLSRALPSNPTICTAPPSAASPSHAPHPSSSSSSAPRTRRLSLSGSSSTPLQRSAPIPISPTSPPRSSPSGGAKDRISHRDRGLVGAGGGARETNLAQAIRYNDPHLLRREAQAHGRLESSSSSSAAGAKRGGKAVREDAGSEGSDGSGESYDVPIIDTSRAGGQALTAAALSGLGKVPTSGAGKVGGVKYSNGRRMSSLATYTGLPQPPCLVPGGVSGGAIGHGNGAGGGGRGEGEGFQYSLGGLSRTGSSGGARRASISTGMVRPPSPAGNALKSVHPLTSSTTGGGGATRRPPSPARTALGAGLRRASTPTGSRPLPSQLLPSHFAGGEGSTPGTASLLSSSSALASASSLSRSTSGLGTPSSTSAGGSASRRPPSPAGGRGRPSSSLAQSAHASRSVRAPSPARPSGLVRAASPGPAGGPRIIRGFDAPSSPPLSFPSSSTRSPSPSRHSLHHNLSTSSHTPHLQHGSNTHLSRARSASRSSSVHRQPLLLPGASTYPPSPTVSSPTASTRPRSGLANPHLDERLEIAASRDFEALDDYYERRRYRERDREREGTGESKEEERRIRREAEERLRRGYDRLSAVGR
ncbi:hypothetical protein JCM8547_008559 [Rhodosporidiobolus lusitaniae]